MRITESKLRRIIRNILTESRRQQYRGQRVSASVGDRVLVLHVDPPYHGRDRMDWGGCDGYISSIQGDVCTITDPTRELVPLRNQPLDSEYIRVMY